MFSLFLSICPQSQRGQVVHCLRGFGCWDHKFWPMSLDHLTPPPLRTMSHRSRPDHGTSDPTQPPPLPPPNEPPDFSPDYLKYSLQTMTHLTRPLPLPIPWVTWPDCPTTPSHPGYGWSRKISMPRLIRRNMDWGVNMGCTRIQMFPDRPCSLLSLRPSGSSIL